MAMTGAFQVDHKYRGPNCVKERTLQELQERSHYDKWKQVISRLPKHQITGDKIDEELGHLKPARKRINVTREVAEQLEQEATLSGVKTNQLIKELLEDEEESNQAEEDKDDKNVQTRTVEPQKIKRWLADLEDLIKSHDREIWLACMLLKLSPWQLVPL